MMKPIKAISRTIKKILRIIIVLLPCFCMMFTPITTYAEENEPDITIEFSSENVLDENTPMVMSDEYIDVSSFINAGTLIYTNSSGKGASLFNTAYNYTVGNEYMLVYKVNFPTTYDSGNLDITIYYVSEQVNYTTSDFQLTNNGNGIFSMIKPSRVQFIPEKVQDGVTYASYYILEFKDVQCNNDFTGFRLQFNFNVSENQGLETKFPMRMEISYNDETSGLLGGIIEIVRNIFDGIKNLPTNIANSIKGFFDNVVNSLVNLMNVLKNAITDLGTFIIDGLKSLFIPSDDYFQTYFNDLYDFFDEKLGILFFPFEIITSLLNKFLSITEGSGVINIPNVYVMDYLIIQATSFDLKAAFTQILGNYYSLYYAFVDCIFIFIFINSIKRRLDNILESGG